jgi:hypothetical protein
MKFPIKTVIIIASLIWMSLVVMVLIKLLVPGRDNIYYNPSNAFGNPGELGRCASEIYDGNLKGQNYIG